MRVLFRPARRRLPISVVVVSGVLVIAGCGSSNKPSSASKSTLSSTTPGLAFSKCMRSHSVPNFPDPSANGPFQVQVGNYPHGTSVEFSDNIPGINQQSPAYRAAFSACQKLLPVASPPQPGQQTHPSVAAMAQAQAWAKCMRAHGLSNWPDPTPIMPTGNPNAYEDELDINGVVVLIPKSDSIYAPAVKQAAGACNFPLP